MKPKTVNVVQLKLEREDVTKIKVALEERVASNKACINLYKPFPHKFGEQIESIKQDIKECEELLIKMKQLD